MLESERRWNEAEGGLVNMAELCRMFGVSRQTGYTWVERYREGNPPAGRCRRAVAAAEHVATRHLARDGRPDRRGAEVLPAVGTKLHERLVERNPGKGTERIDR